MNKGYYKVKKPENERIIDFCNEKEEAEKLKKAIEEIKSKKIEIPLIIGGKEIKTNHKEKSIIPHDKDHVLAEYYVAGEDELKLAIIESLKAKKKWEKMSFEHRASIFLKAANLLSNKYRYIMNAAAMLGQSKTPYQAEIDAACELIDFMRFNAYFAQEIYSEQPESTVDDWNRMEYRPLEGFVLAISPFNFTSIGGNLNVAPAILGNVVNWKPSSAAVYSNYIFMQILKEAGLPDGVINFIPSRGKMVSDIMIKNENFAGIHFTGSTETFSEIWKTVGENIRSYKSYPRLVGETGGKDFIFAHKSADIDLLTSSIIRGSFEYQGQKCSASSRAYIPKSIWEEVKEKLFEKVDTINIGPTEDFSNYMGAVIDKNSFDKITGYIEYVRESDDSEIIYGGSYDDTEGYFIQPTIVLTTNSRDKTMENEIFGPIITIYLYDDYRFEETLELCDTTSPYALTGAIFAKDREVISYMEEKLSYAAGNFYINDKPTGAVVGHQPFGGSRASGTNDKAGSKLNLYRWLNPRVIKENFKNDTSL
ncbi:MAG: L-glutamate gamma-semialdehyde dehydrogenase [Bacillota bacterium]|nr:L-glutamate gamma-semialdehyde dehydrogenase [Bacillota bacterium]